MSLGGRVARGEDDDSDYELLGEQSYGLPPGVADPFLPPGDNGQLV